MDFYDLTTKLTAHIVPTNEQIIKCRQFWNDMELAEEQEEEAPSVESMFPVHSDECESFTNNFFKEPDAEVRDAFHEYEDKIESLGISIGEKYEEFKTRGVRV